MTRLLKYTLFCYMTYIGLFLSQTAVSQTLLFHQKQNKATAEAVAISAKLHSLKNSIFKVKNTYYDKTTKYFLERNRSFPHFLSIGLETVIIESIYPFQTTAYPFFAYLNYRVEKWGNTKIPISFSVQYGPLLKPISKNKIYILSGIRYPKSSDLNLFHVDFMFGFSFPLNWKWEKTDLQLRLLATHIIGPKASTHRLYFQWGLKAFVHQNFHPGLIMRLGLDNHL